MLSTDDQLYGQWLNVLGSTPLDSPRLDDDPDADPVAVHPRDLEVVRPDGQN